MAILAALAAVLYPAVAVQIRKGQTTALADQLNNLRVAISNFRSNVQRYPHRLNQLTEVVTAGQPDICNGGIPAANANAWRGPYLAQNLVGTTIAVGDATVQFVLVRVPPTNAGGPFGMLQIVAANVDSTSAADLEAQFDGNNNFATGTILWVPVGGVPTGTLTFQMPIRDC